MLIETFSSIKYFIFLNDLSIILPYYVTSSLTTLGLYFCRSGIQDLIPPPPTFSNHFSKSRGTFKIFCSNVSRFSMLRDTFTLTCSTNSSSLQFLFYEIWKRASFMNKCNLLGSEEAHVARNVSTFLYPLFLKG